MITFKNLLQKKKGIKRLITICLIAGLIITVTGTAQAALDIDGIYMTSCKDYVDGTESSSTPWDLEIWVEINAGDLDHIDVTLSGGLSSFTIYEDSGYWEYESPSNYSSLTALQVDYPAGNYTFDFRNGSGGLLDSVTLNYSGINEPLNPVDFTYPAHGAINVPLNPKYTWNVNSNDGNALGMWVWDPTEDDDAYENVPAPMNTLEWTPGPLDPNQPYGLEVSVFNVKDPQPGPALPIGYTDGSDDFTYGLMIEYCNELGFTTVPEPATIALLGFGALSLLCRRKA